MKKQFPKKTYTSALVLAAILTSALISGCGSDTNAAVVDSIAINDAKENVTTVAKETPSEYLTSFLSLHHKFCEKKYASSFSLMQTLQTASSLKLADNFEGVYEVTINNISFAVSPEEDGCTTDVMLIGDDELLFTFEDINEALIKKGYIETGDPVSRKDLGIDQSELTVIEKKYISPAGEVTVLNFPLEKKDKYYMTLFVEKFLGEKNKNKVKLFQSLRMASLSDPKKS